MVNRRDAPALVRLLTAEAALDGTGAALADQERAHYRAAQMISRVGSWRYQVSTGALTVSDALLSLCGIEAATFSGTYDTIETRVHTDDRAQLRAAASRLMRRGLPMRIRFRIVPEVGAPLWVDARGGCEEGPEDSPGAPDFVVGTIADVTELVEAELDTARAHAEERRANDFQQAIITATPDAIHIYDVTTATLSRANRHPQPLVGFTDAEALVMIGDYQPDAMPAEDRARLEATFLAAQLTGDGALSNLRHRVRHADGEERWLSRRMTPFARDEDGTVVRILVVSRDVTDVVEMEHRLETAATHDDLTGLPNRRLLRRGLDEALGRASGGAQLALLVCDLDGFKRINDRHGHHVGDQVLQVVGLRLQKCCRSEDMVARMGGDEFAILLSVPAGADPTAFAESIAERLQETIKEPIRLGNFEHQVSVSIGIRLIEEPDGRPAHTGELLLGDADAAMYYVKSHGANGHVLFDPVHRPDQTRRVGIERGIRHALAEDAVVVYYQPIVDPRSVTIHGVEALLRIPDLTGGFIPTPEVIAVAEDTGLMTALDARVLEIACQQGAAWRRQPGLEHLMLKINRSVQDIAKPGFADRIMRALEVSGLDAQALTVEITETVLLDATDTNLNDLRLINTRGIGLAIDDFGTGYASLRYLAELPITCIKIDRSFTARLPHDRTSATLVRATVGLAEQLGMNCIVEGVETQEQLESLPAYERLLIQGYFYGRPQSAAQQLPYAKSVAGQLTAPG